MELNPTTTRYDAGNALWMARISKYAYLRNRQGQAKLEDKAAPDPKRVLSLLQEDDPRFTDVRGFSHNSSQGLVIKHRDCIVVAFRGTDEIADWLDNIKARAVGHALGRVHRGFHEALWDVWPAMIRAVDDWQPKRKNSKHLPIWLTGHSLGGAMATLAAAQLIEEDRPFYGLYTYGSPRTGDRDFARTYNIEAASRTFRFQNNNDIVTRVPARLMNYSHVGKFVYISQKGELSTDAGRWFRFLDSVRGVIYDIGDVGFDGIEDHSIDEYMSAIEAWGDKPLED